jgi:membrane protein DedA with SNARE-associated domain
MIDLLVSHASYLAIVAVMVATGFGLPLPEEAVVVVAGVFASQGKLDSTAALLCCIGGAIVGDLVVYGIGRHFGQSVVRKHRFWAHFVSPETEARMERLIGRHGVKVLFVSRFLVGVRTPVYLTAGILRVPVQRFLLADLFCASIVVSTFFFVSYYHGMTIANWIRRAEVGLTVTVALTAVLAGLYLWRRHAVRERPSQEEHTAEDQPEEVEPAAERHIDGERPVNKLETAA